MTDTLIYWTLTAALLPFASCAMAFLFGKRGSRLIPVLCTLLSLVSVSAVVYIFIQVWNQGPVKYEWPWFAIGDNAIPVQLSLNNLSVLMMVVVTTISFLVHVYSIGYMAEDAHGPRYFAMLGFFTGSMLGVVLAENLLLLFFCWELMGFSSYILISHWRQRKEAGAAGSKAFVMNRIGDMGLLIALMIIWANQGTLEIDAFTGVELSEPWVMWAGMFIVVGVLGKSAQFPLLTWLPDAMEGPTPVSALIHAATMVVAGVYLVARLFPLYALNGASLEIVLNVGLFTALFAAIIACTQTDIKRVLAYSTMSQIGFMMFALGVSGTQGEQGLGYTASMFHLFTHAFFKSLLFLGAGAVIHFVHSNEMKDMGGLRKWMPLTHLAFLIACLAIAGIPPFAGFFSKEEILLATYNKSIWVYAIALITSGLTAFYMFRLYFSIFWRKEYNGHSHPHEGTMSMKIPLIILAVCSALVGLIPFGKFVSVGNQPQETHFHLMFSILPIIIGVAGILIALLMYKKENDRPQNMAQAFGNFYRAAKNKFYMDELYLFVTKNIIFKWVGRPSAWFDRKVVDGSMDEIANLTLETSKAIKGLQSGKVQRYAMYFFGGIAFLIILFVYILK